jgi:uncharacterized membrane protein
MKEDVQVTSEEEIHISKTGSLRPLNEEARSQSIRPQPIPQKLSLSEFNTAMVHFYRGEIQRSNVWRTRLDTTTNWAVITTGATLSFVFSSPDNPHFVIPINTILVAIFLFMEARRYRYYEVWASRVRILETGYFAPMLSKQAIPQNGKWAEHLSADLLSPHFTISEWEAIGRRLRRNYIWIFVLLALSWTLKVYLHPYPIPSGDPRIIEVFLERAAVGLAPGWLVILAGFIFNLSIFIIAIATLRLHDASSEVKPLEKFEWHPLKKMRDWAEARYKVIRRAKKTRQRLQSIENTKAPNS